MLSLWTVSECNNGSCATGTCWNREKNTCLRAPPGKFSNASMTTCIDCSPGLYSNIEASWSCTQCSVGTYAPSNSSTFCDFCSVGRFADQIGTVACADCPLGTWTTNVGSTDVSDCSGCASGYFSVNSTCVACSPGKFSSIPNSQCVDCPAGSYSSFNSTACLQCAQNSFASTGSSACTLCPFGASTNSDNVAGIESCFCLKGTYGKAFQGFDCKPCVEEYLQCDKDNYTIGYVVPGYWRDSYTGAVLECSPSESCFSTGLNSTTVCADGYTGRKCGACAFFTHYRIGGSCASCGGNIAKSVILLLLIFLIIGAFITLSRMKGFRIPVFVKIAFYWVQLISTFPYLLDSWPKKLLNFLQVMAASNVSLDLVSPGKHFFNSSAAIDGLLQSV
jgi:hypothetical protein